jgi:hypothetical protein
VGGQRLPFKEPDKYDLMMESKAGVNEKGNFGYTKPHRHDICPIFPFSYIPFPVSSVSVLPLSLSSADVTYFIGVSLS